MSKRKAVDQRPDNVYDKADYHIPEVEDRGLPKEHAYNHTTFFLSWAIANALTSSSFERQGRAILQKYRKGDISINELYEWWDCQLNSEMLSPVGNAFAEDYFNLQHRDQYLRDYKKALRKRLPSDYHVPYTMDNEMAIHSVIAGRYEDWLKGNKARVAKLSK